MPAAFINMMQLVEKNAVHSCGSGLWLCAMATAFPALAP